MEHETLLKLVFIIEHYQEMSEDEISKALNLSRNYINGLCGKLGITCQPISHKIIPFVKAHYQTMSTIEMASELHISISRVRKACKTLGVKAIIHYYRDPRFER